MRILVIGGGISNEREVSLKSSRSIFDAISTIHDKFFYDWDGGEQWLNDNLANFDVALPILHGVGGEDGQIQSILEKANIKYLGSDSRSSKICIDKKATQELLKSQNILVPGFGALTYQQYQESDFINKRHVVKPNDGGSSLNTFIDVRPDDPRSDQIKKAFDTRGSMMVEDFISGVEVTVPVLEGKELPLIEIVPPEGEFFDYDNKYNGKTQEICPSENVASDLQKNAQMVAKKAHDILGCRHLSRVDIIIDQRGQMYVLEVNTMPGMTTQSLFPKSAQVSGMSMTGFVDYLIELASNTQN